MKIIHTADWHLGKSFNNYSLLEEQAYILEAFRQIVSQEKPDVVILAGDIYDRSLPPADAVRLFDEVMSQIVLDLNIPVIAVAGNHDNADRVNYCNYLLQKQGLHIFGSVQIPIQPVVLSDEYGAVYFYPIPYTDPEVMRYYSHEESIRSHAQAMEWLVKHIRDQHPAGKRSVLIGHAFIAGGEESESERQLLVGGAANIPAHLFAGFDYCAFGHLHQPQVFSQGKLQYCGSILKYSFSEAHHQKGVLLLELGAQGEVTYRQIPLVPRKDIHRVRGKIIERHFQLNAGYEQVKPEDFLEVSLENAEMVPNAMQIVQEQYPNTLTLKWPTLQRVTPASHLTSEHLHKMDESDLFLDFYERFTGQKPDTQKEQILQNTLRNIRKEME